MPTTVLPSKGMPALVAAGKQMVSYKGFFGCNNGEGWMAFLAPLRVMLTHRGNARGIRMIHSWAQLLQ